MNPALCSHSFTCSPSKPCQTWPSWTTYSTRSCDMRSTMSSRPFGLSTRRISRIDLRGIGDEVRDEKQHGGVERRRRRSAALRSCRCEARRWGAPRVAPARRRASDLTRRRRSRVPTDGASASLMCPAPHPRSPTTQFSSRRSSSASRSVRAPIMSARILSQMSDGIQKEDLRFVAALGEHALGATRVLRWRQPGRRLARGQATRGLSSARRAGWRPSYRSGWSLRRVR